MKGYRMQNDLMQYYLAQILKNLKNNNITDFTTEDVTVSSPHGGKLKVRFYTEDKWLKDPSLKATTAQIIMKQSYKGSKIPDYTVVFEDTTYLVKNLQHNK